MNKIITPMGTQFLFSLIFVLISPLYLAAQQATTHTVTLSVDTETISNSNIDQTCNFGQDEGITNKDFTILVDRGDHIIWEAFSSTNSEEDKVQIIAISHEGGTNLFGLPSLVGSAQNPGIVIGTINQGESGNIQKYNVVFQVFSNGVLRGTFTIDPKIQVKN